MDPLLSGSGRNMKANRFSTLAVVLATLVLGILIGTVVTRGVKGKTVDSSDASPLQMPAPQQLSTVFSQVAKQIEPAVVNINTESIVKNPHAGQRRRQAPNDDQQAPGGDEDNPFQD